MPGNDFDLQTCAEGDLAVLQLSGDLDLGVVDLVDRLETAVEPFLTLGATVVLDCAEVAFFDSSGVRVLVHIAKLARQADADIALAAVPGGMRQVLEQTGADALFTLHAGLAEAMAEIATQAKGRVPPIHRTRGN